MAELPTDRVALDEYMAVWFRAEVPEAVEVRSTTVTFRTDLQERIASRRHVIQHLEKIRSCPTSGWLERLNEDQDDDISLFGLLDTFVHRMCGIVRKRERHWVFIGGWVRIVCSGKVGASGVVCVGSCGGRARGVLGKTLSRTKFSISVSRNDQQEHNQQERYLNCQQERLNAISRNDLMLSAETNISNSRNDT
ncbi:hypothetical protein Tco_0006711 [Tanacetum coccineum]